MKMALNDEKTEKQQVPSSAPFHSHLAKCYKISLRKTIFESYMWRRKSSLAKTFRCNFMLIRRGKKTKRMSVDVLKSWDECYKLLGGGGGGVIEGKVRLQSMKKVIEKLHNGLWPMAGHLVTYFKLLYIKKCYFSPVLISDFDWGQVTLIGLKNKSFIFIVRLAWKRHLDQHCRTAGPQKAPTSSQWPWKLQSWALSVFFHFFTNKKWFFAFFIKLIWLGMGFLNRTGAEIGYYFHKKCIKSFFVIEKIKKYRKCPALPEWPTHGPPAAPYLTSVLCPSSPMYRTVSWSPPPPPPPPPLSLLWSLLPLRLWRPLRDLEKTSRPPAISILVSLKALVVPPGRSLLRGGDGGGKGQLKVSLGTGGRAGHLTYFLIFSIIKNDFLHFL